MIFASAFSAWDVCLLLIKRGADITYKAPDGTTIQDFVDLFEKDNKGTNQMDTTDFDELKAIIRKQKPDNSLLKWRNITLLRALTKLSSASTKFV
ncbi:hypothetical protein GO730_08020 [Spirosoma sp. HMF3257]|uniref:Ankyrin repeat domain-containing protein n=1 Tax=Spirosoma telluris TaxID=2183553 RepID=A0A327NFY6_9BACT|nr:hypothetical protein [Spirosoma telluris]RAI74270.1 hypothetical protein HMF3257_07930 [Spirosoma telluris]